MQPRLDERATGRDRAGDRLAVQLPFGAQRDDRARGVVAVAVLERRLQRLEFGLVHGREPNLDSRERDGRRRDGDNGRYRRWAARGVADAFPGSVEPGDDGYEDARRVHNGLIDRRPALIARCQNTADIADAVRFARAQGLDICVRGGGHNVAGRAVVDGALMIDLAPIAADVERVRLRERWTYDVAGSLKTATTRSAAVLTS